MIEKIKKYAKTAIAGMLVLSLILQAFHGMQFVSANEATGPETYTITLENAVQVFICNNDTPTEYPVTLTYTVQEADKSSTQTGFIATTTPEADYPYTEGAGSLRFWSWNRLMTAGRTYEISLSLDSGNQVAYQVTQTQDGETKNWDYQYDTPDRMAGSSNANATFFGIWLSEGSENAVLTNVSCVDAAGNDLGVKAKAADGTCVAVKDKEPETYTVTMTNAAQVLICNNLAPADGKVKLVYTVSERTSKCAESGVVATSTPTAQYPFTDATADGKGSIYKWGWSRMTTVDYTYEITMNLNSSDKMIEYTLNRSKNGTPDTWDTTYDTAQYRLGTADEDATYFGIWLDGYDDNMETSVLTNVSCVDGLGNDLGVRAKVHVGAVTVVKNESEEPTEPELPPENLTEITPETLGFDYKEFTKDTSTEDFRFQPSSGVLNAKFKTKVFFSKPDLTKGGSYISYGGFADKFTGIRIMPYIATGQDGTNLRIRAYDLASQGTDIVILEPSKLQESDLTSFSNTEFEFAMDIWESGDDVKLMVYINGEAYEDKVFTWKDAAKNNYLGEYIYFKGDENSIGDVLIIGEEKPLEQLPTDFTTITLNDFGLKDGSYEDTAPEKLTVYGNANLDKKILSTTVNCADNNMQLFYGTTAKDYSGLYFLFLPTHNQIHLQQGTDGTVYTFTGVKGGFDLSNNRTVDLKITTEYVGEGDLKVGVFINGVLYNNKYIIMTGFASSVGTYVSIHRAQVGSGTLGVSTPKHMLPSTYKQMTFKDFGIGDARNASIQAASLSGVEVDWDGLIFSGKASLDKYENDIRFGAGSGGWIGPRLVMKNQKLTFNHADGTTFGDIAVWDSITYGDLFTFSIATEYLDFDNDGAEDDLKIGIWIDGEMYGNRWFYLVDCQLATTEACVSVCLGATTKQYTILSYLPSTASGTYDNGKYYYNLAQGGYLLTTQESIVVNGENMSNGDVLDTAQDYTIVRTEGNEEYTSTVILYKTGDAHPDGATDVCDLIAIKKLAAGHALSTESGQKGADVNKDYVVSDADVIKMRNVLIGEETIDTSVQNASVSYASGDATVMPIAGYYGAYGDLLTEDIYKLIQGSGINLITYSKDTYNVDGETDNVIRQLQLAEKYGISLFIRDKDLTNKTYTAAEIADNIAVYSKYQSFKGLTIFDEPSATNVEYGTSTEKLSQFSKLSSSIQSYGNLTAYTNLYPLDANQGTEEGYKAYLEEYCTTYNPKMLSFDNYPFVTTNVKNTQNYFKNLAIVRDKAIEHNIPFWAFVQAGSNFEGQDKATNNSTPTAAEFKWNVNMNLAFGAKGIQYFPLVQPDEFAVTNDGSGADYKRNGLIGANGETNTWYDYAVEANAQIAAVDDVLMNSESKGIMTVGTYAKTNTKNSGMPVHQTYEMVQSLTTSESGLFTYGAVAGCFDYRGKTAVYVVNYNVNKANTITLSFDKEYQAEVINQEGTRTTSGQSCSVLLPAGGAALVVIE